MVYFNKEIYSFIVLHSALPDWPLQYCLHTPLATVSTTKKVANMETKPRRSFWKYIKKKSKLFYL